MSETDVKLASNWFEKADAILVTASNGLSISEGLNLFDNDDKLKEVLGDLVDTYHLTNLLSAMSRPYENRLDYWRVIARVVEYYGNHYQISSFMNDIKDFIKQKPYFVWTSNIDHHFSLAGFENVFEHEGNWMSGICSANPESHGAFDLADKLHEFFLKDQNGTLTEVDIPRCAKCDAEISLNLAGENFQVDQQKLTDLQEFINDYSSSRLLVLELGIGPQNQMIKAPTMQMIGANKNSRYITINQGEIFIPMQIAKQSVGFSSSIGVAFKEIKANHSFGAHTQGPSQIKQETPQNIDEIEQQEKIMQKFYPYYMVDQGFQPNSVPMYLTIDKMHPSYLHATKYGQAFMYDMGGSVLVHCFTSKGEYYKVRLGLDKTQGDVHAFYTDPGTFVGIESVDDTFSVINTEIPVDDTGEIFVPQIEKLLEVFPGQQQIIRRLTHPE